MIPPPPSGAHDTCHASHKFNIIFRGREQHRGTGGERRPRHHEEVPEEISDEIPAAAAIQAADLVERLTPAAAIQAVDLVERLTPADPVVEPSSRRQVPLLK